MEIISSVLNEFFFAVSDANFDCFIFEEQKASGVVSPRSWFM